jgi:hypothetical protein
VEGVAGEEEFFFESGGPAGFDELEVGGFVGAVDFIAEDGVAGVGEVDADLVHAAGVGEGADEGEGFTVGVLGGRVLEAGDDVEVGAGGLAVGVDHLFDPDGGGGEFAFAAEGLIDGEGVLLGVCPDEGEVFFMNLPPLHGEREAAGGFGIFGDEDEAGRFAVEAIDDGEAGAVGDVVGEEFLEAVEEGGRVIGIAGVDEEVRGFCHDDVIGGFVDDGEVGVMEGVVDGELF